MCGSRSAVTIFVERTIPVVRCAGCRHVYSLARRPDHYQGYFGAGATGPDALKWWDDAHRTLYRAFCRRFLRQRQGRLLDVGCGLGYFVRQVAGMPGWQAEGIDASPIAVTFAQHRLQLGERVRCGRVQDGPWAPGRFDVITLWDVIEHLPRPVPVLQAVHRLLQPHGFVFLHTPGREVQLWKARLKRWWWGMQPEMHYLEAADHLHLYSRASLGRLLRRAGFPQSRTHHLPPIQSVAGNTTPWLRRAKNAWVTGATILWHLSGGTANLNNLFVQAWPRP